MAAPIDVPKGVCLKANACPMRQLLNLQAQALRLQVRSVISGWSACGTPALRRLKASTLSAHLPQLDATHRRLHMLLEPFNQSSQQV